MPNTLPDLQTPFLDSSYNYLGSLRPFGPGEYVRNSDGTWSSEYSATVSDPKINAGKPSVIPRLWVRNGKPIVLSEDEAASAAARSGLDFPVFSTLGDADKFANAREARWQKVGAGDKAVPSLWKVPASAYLPDWSQAEPADPVVARAQQRLGSGIIGAAGNVLNSLWDFIKIPGDVYAGKYSLNEISRLAPGYALGLAGAGTPIGAATLPENALGVFAGAKSLSAPHLGLRVAKGLESQGYSAEEIHSLTDWFRGPDKSWQYTIPDAQARIRAQALEDNAIDRELGSFLYAFGRPRTLSNVLHHPELYRAYPELAKYPVESATRADVARGYAGAFDPVTKTFTLSGDKPENMLSTLLHETQHAIQQIEGFPRGASLHEFLPEDMYVQPPAIQQRQFRGALDKYTRAAGEVQARAVQEQLAGGDWTTPVWKHEGYIPFEQQIVLAPVDHDPFAIPELSFTGYHGSPHEFPAEPGARFGRFKSEAIGSGEGAQSYGAGHYIAGHPQTAEEYKLPGDHTEFTLDGKPLSYSAVASTSPGMGRGIERLLAYGGVKTALDTIPWEIKGLKEAGKSTQELEAAFDWLKENQSRIGKSSGHMYEVRVSPEHEEFLDWNKKLGDQEPFVKERLQRFLGRGFNPDITGQQLYHRLGRPDQASQQLRALGIAGNTYLDAGSRHLPEELKHLRTYNYVVFDPKNLEIVGRNGEKLGLTPVENDPFATRP